MGDISDYVTVAQAAALLGLSKSRVEQFIRSGEIAVASTLGRVRLLRKSDVEAVRPKVRGKVGRPPSRPHAPAKNSRKHGRPKKK